ncbi:bactofilin family protein [Paenibacillus lemnae]|uniref:Polymer-forming cytoskeletal protein n=1 Tax=Paenibacillus lemnae TaxID=1330551 RepID=A0A848M4M2_PAELE|nr:polymer-forming cytoskeletal protein [Paenibacillus lemnae]NMO95725.1 polymer-forming cytoskeletal protein [Paenibacillus lemnae]
MKKSRKKKKQAAQGPATLISQGSLVEGKLSCETDLRIDGQFQGDIESTAHVTIGEGAVARSTITAVEVIVAGTVYGDINAEEKLTITRTGQMYGDVAAASLIIMEGGVLNGASHMNHCPESSSPAEPLALHRPEAG